jgi:hypothetical protein
MKPAKLERIRRIRAQADQLMTAAHVAACQCCRIDLLRIREEADDPMAFARLAIVHEKIELATARAERSEKATVAPVAGSEQKSD